ncbi:hypothetical protein ACFL1H_01145 [Nanoarchaeota archaeon]
MNDFEKKVIKLDKKHRKLQDAFTIGDELMEARVELNLAQEVLTVVYSADFIDKLEFIDEIHHRYEVAKQFGEVIAHNIKIKHHFYEDKIYELIEDFDYKHLGVSFILRTIDMEDRHERLWNLETVKVFNKLKDKKGKSGIDRPGYNLVSILTRPDGNTYEFKDYVDVVLKDETTEIINLLDHYTGQQFYEHLLYFPIADLDYFRESEVINAINQMGKSNSGSLFWSMTKNYINLLHHFPGDKILLDKKVINAIRKDYVQSKGFSDKLLNKVYHTLSKKTYDSSKKTPDQFVADYRAVKKPKINFFD